MKKQKNKPDSKFRKFLSGFKISFIFGLLVLVFETITIAAICFVWGYFHNKGFINEANFKMIFFSDFTLVSIIAGALVSIIILHLPISGMQRLLQAVQKITRGDYSVRLREHKRIKFVNNIVINFNNMARQLESTETLSHEFINNFSHEFKTPISSINGFANLLKSGNLSKDEQEECIDVIIQESARLGALSSNILMLSKLEQQSILTNKTRFDISEQIRLAIVSLYTKWHEKNIEIEFDEKEIYIFGNQEMLAQAWINLIDNAIKFSPEGEKIKIDIKAQKSFVQCTVSNKGTPIDEEKKSHIFNRFYQGDTSHATSGCGLGLPMVKRITELHGGTIKLKQSDSEATVFELTIPINNE